MLSSFLVICCTASSRPDSWGKDIDNNNFDAVVDASTSVWVIAFSDSSGACAKCSSIDDDFVGLVDSFFDQGWERKLVVGRVETSSADGKALMERLQIGKRGGIPSVHMFLEQYNATSTIIVDNSLESSAEHRSFARNKVAAQPVDDTRYVTKHLLPTPLEVNDETKLPSTAGGLVPISWDSRLFKIDHFLSDEECDLVISGALNGVSRERLQREDRVYQDILGAGQDEDQFWRMSSKQQQLIKQIELRIAAMTMIPPHPEEAWTFVQRTPCKAVDETNEHEKLHDDRLYSIRNVHHDENFAPNRVATVLIYLTDVVEGGHTVFPTARLNSTDEECVTLNADITAAHLAGKRVIDMAERNATFASAFNGTAAVCERKNKCGVRVTPKRGTAIIFWHRHEDGS
jgi:prolyl 4-hydroxylase